MDGKESHQHPSPIFIIFVVSTYRRLANIKFHFLCIHDITIIDTRVCLGGNGFQKTTTDFWNGWYRNGFGW